MILPGYPNMMGARKTKGPIAFRSSTIKKSLSTNVSQIVVDKPAGVAAGDLLILVVSMSMRDPSQDTVTPPAGFVQVGVAFNPYMWTFRVFTKIATGSEPSTYTVTLGADYSSWSISMMSFENASAVGTVGDAQILATTSSQSTAPSINAVGGGALVMVAGFAVYASVSSKSADLTPYLVSPPDGHGAVQAIFGLIPSPTGATGTRYVNWSSSHYNGCFLMEVLP